MYTCAHSPGYTFHMCVYVQGRRGNLSAPWGALGNRLITRMSLGTHETSGRTGEKIAWDCRSAFRVVELRFANKEGNWLGGGLGAGWEGLPSGERRFSGEGQLVPSGSAQKHLKLEN